MAITYNWAQSGNISSNGTSVSVSADGSTINLNDLLIACVVPESGTTNPGPVTAPPGWAQLEDAQMLIGGGAPATAAVFYKIADAGDASGNFTFTWASGALCSWTLMDYSGVNTSAPIDAFSSQTNDAGYSNDTTAPSLVTTNAGDTLVNIWVSNGGSNPYVGDPSTNVRVSTDSNSSTLPEIMAADKTLSSSGLTSSDVMTQLYGSVDQRGFSIALNCALCFMPGTMIMTPCGEVQVETIVRGAYVTTTDGRAEKVSWIGRQTVDTRFADPLRVLPVRIKAAALGDNVPSRDLLLSPDHAILVGDVLIQAGALVNGTSIVTETNVPLTFTYYHVELEDHSLILAENVPAETFIDNVDRLAFDNWQQHKALYPEGRSIVEMPYPRAKAHRQVPRAIRKQLAERAAVLVGETKEVAA